MDEKPRLRPVEAILVRTKGQEMVALHDPLRYSDEVVMVSPETLLVLSRFDGTRDVRQVQEELMRQTGQLVPSSEISGMLEKLDGAHLLENEGFRKFLAAKVADYLALPERPPALAGQAYPENRVDLQKALDAWFLEAAKLPDDSAHGGAAAAKIILPAGFDRGEAADERGSVRGLVAPHIDPRRGGPCIAKAYAKVREDPAELYVVFGTAHGECGSPYALTRKSYRTPLGLAPTDTALVDDLVASAGEDLLDDEFAHRAEHSVEFQVLFLQHALGERPFRILPVLCGSLYGAVAAGVSPDLADLRVARFHLALASALARSRSKVCFVAGADLSHVGQRFGDRAAPDEATRTEIERHDRSLLAAASEADANGFDAIVRNDRDRHRVCGYPPIYALLRATAGATGRLLRYEQSIETDAGSLVSYASLVLR